MNRCSSNRMPLDSPAPGAARRSGLVRAFAALLTATLALALNQPAAAAADAKAGSAATSRSKAAASAPKSATVKSPASTNAAPAEAQAAVAEIPRSVFLLSSPTQTLKDPFFPNSTRLSATPAAKTAGQKKDAPAAELSLKAIFGTPSRPFATINSTTLSAGEEQDVLTPAGRVRVRCLEINLAAQSVVIEVAGSRRELRFGTPK